MFNFLLAQSCASGTGYIMPIMLVLVIVFIFFTGRNRRKQERKEAEERDNLQVGDEVTTIGGIIGKVVSIKEETFVLETTKDKTKIRFLKGAIRSIDLKIADLVAAKAAEAVAANAAKSSPEDAANDAPATEATIEEPKGKKSKKKKKSKDAEAVDSAVNTQSPAEEK